MIPQWQKIDLAKEIKEADQAIRKANKCADEGFKLAKEMKRQRLEKLLREKIEEQKTLVNISELNTYWAKKHLNKLRTTLFKVTGKIVHFGKLCIFISSLSLICMVAHAEPITQSDIDRYIGKVPPRVIFLMKHFKTTEALQQFAEDRRIVRDMIKHSWKKDKMMHRLWKYETITPYQYQNIVRGK